MNWRLAGVAQAATMAFLVDGQPVVPDADSIVFTAWNHAGVQIESYAFTPEPGDSPTQMEVVMSAALNTLDSATLFEARYLRGDFLYNGRPYFCQTTYRLHHMIPMTASPQDVRSLIAADYDELPDRDVDLIEAYISLLASFGSNFALALIRNDLTALHANQAIALQAAIKLCPSFQSRLLKLEKADNSGYQRADIDFIKLEADLRNQLARVLALIEPIYDIQVAASDPHTLFIVTKQTDRITNSDS